MSVPRLLLVLVSAALFRPSNTTLVLVLGGTTWTGLARMVRAETLTFRRSSPALAARAAGSSTLRLIVRHLVPQIAPVLVVFAALRFADTIVLESALSFLGLGAPPPAVSLGDVLASGREALYEAWWVAAAPGALIAAIVLTVRSASRGCNAPFASITGRDLRSCISRSAGARASPRVHRRSRGAFCSVRRLRMARTEIRRTRTGVTSRRHRGRARCQLRQTAGARIAHARGIALERPRSRACRPFRSICSSSSCS